MKSNHEYWEVITYHQSQKERIPRVYELKDVNFSVKIHRHIHYPETWLLSCLELDIRRYDLETDSFDEAANRAIAYLLEYLHRYSDLRKTLSEIMEVTI